MESIPLRAYNRDIEQMIDNNRSQDALLHCQLILDNYPRCLETFRLMGKAYLELQQYEKAEETFQKVLSSIPDDFTANLGVSLLREKQNNLDGTIWHMERAYEAQPSNTAVQSELRRLYQQRDGIETSRIRLTRGALVRMYIRGDLIPQALNEIQAILHEDPSRIDIRILHATALLKSGKKEEALLNCQEIVRELPYCYEANRILFENPSSTMRIEDAQSYQQHLKELDPYYEFTSAVNPDPLKISEDEVKIGIPEDLYLQKTGGLPKGTSIPSTFETLTKIPPVEEFSYNQVETNSPKIDKKESLEEEKPAWLKGIEIATEKSDPLNKPEFTSEQSYTPRKEHEFSEPMTTEEPSPNPELPNQKENPSEQSQESSIQSNPFLTSTGGLIPVAEPGEIPEWLRALASEPPAASSDAITAPLRVPGETGVLQTGEENLDFLRNLPGEPRTDQPERPQNMAVESLPGIIPADPFLVTSETTQPIPLEENEVEKPLPIREVPEWLKSAAENTVDSSVMPNKPMEFISENPLESKKEPQFSIDEFQITEEQQNPILPESKSEEIPTPEIEQYLEQLRKDVSPGEQPDWLNRDNLGGDLEALFDTDKNSSGKPASSDQTPGWKAELNNDEIEQPEVPPLTPPISVPNVPDWLFTSESGEEDTAPIQLEPPVINQPTPDWLKEIKPDIFASSKEKEPNSQAFQGDSSVNLADSEKTGETENRGIDHSFLESQPIDFLQSDKDSLEDNLASLKAFPTESLPPDLAALLRDETEKDVHTNPLLDEEPVSQSFNPSDFFNNADLLTETEAPQSENEIPGIFEPQSNLEPKLDQFETEQEPQAEIEHIKETGPVIPFEEVKPLEPVAVFEEVHPTKPVEAFEEVQLFKIEDLPEVETTENKPTIQFIPEIQPDIQPVIDEEPAAQFVVEEKPSIQPLPVDEPFIQPVPEVKQTIQPIPEEKPTSPPVTVKKPVSKQKPVAPVAPPVKPIRVQEHQKPVRKIEKPVIAPALQSHSAIVTDLARAREAVARGDLLTALRRYIKLVNANKALDHVSSDLKDLVRKNPKNYLAWQTYGDARLRSNRIQEALDAYAKAADLLK